MKAQVLNLGTNRDSEGPFHTRLALDFPVSLPAPNSLFLRSRPWPSSAELSQWGRGSHIRSLGDGGLGSACQEGHGSVFPFMGVPMDKG